MLIVRRYLSTRYLPCSMTEGVGQPSVFYSNGTVCVHYYYQYQARKPVVLAQMRHAVRPTLEVRAEERVILYIKMVV